MNITKAAVAAVGLAVASTFTLPVFAAKPGSQIITITSPIGSGHDYTGVLDVCNGKFTATGTTTGATATYQELVTGTITDTTLKYTSLYFGEVDDGTGTWDPYSYSVDATVSGTTLTGTYTVTKTNVEAPFQTETETGAISGTVMYDGTLVGSQFRNHGQCIRSVTKQ